MRSRLRSENTMPTVVESVETAKLIQTARDHIASANEEIRQRTKSWREAKSLLADSRRKLASIKEEQATVSQKLESYDEAIQSHEDMLRKFRDQLAPLKPTIAFAVEQEANKFRDKKQRKEARAAELTLAVERNNREYLELQTKVADLSASIDSLRASWVDVKALDALQLARDELVILCGQENRDEEMGADCDMRS